MLGKQVSIYLSIYLSVYLYICIYIYIMIRGMVVMCYIGCYYISVFIIRGRGLSRPLLQPVWANVLTSLEIDLTMLGLATEFV